MSFWEWIKASSAYRERLREQGEALVSLSPRAAPSERALEALKDKLALRRGGQSAEEMSSAVGPIGPF